MGADPLAHPRVWVGLGVAAVASVAWPLATYTLTLALFGLAHVLAELRYVDRRFGGRLGTRLGRSMLGVLVGVMAVRGARALGLLGALPGVLLELGLGLGLVLLVMPALRRRGPVTSAAGLLVAGLLAVSILVAPAAALLALAVLHNFTPVGFVLEARAGPSRRRALRWCAAVFVAVPVLIATGGPWAIAHATGLSAPEASPLGYGPLHEAMHAYLPVALLDPALALHLFAACVFLQGAHYVTVLLVLPHQLPPTAAGRLPWPSARWWPWVLGAALLAVVPFAFDFVAARRGYGIVAAVHAWVEIPILLLAFAGLQPRRHKP